VTERPELLPGSHGPGHVKRCHLANPDEVFRAEVLPEIAPDLVEEK
jgi:peptide/nickel transport system ATP-binding protein